MMEVVKKSKTWTNAAGQEVPVKYIPKIDKIKERAAQKILKDALKLQVHQIRVKEAMMELMDNTFQAMLADANVKTGDKGNFTVTSFNHGIKIEVKIQNKISFDDKVMMAQEKVKEFIELKTKDADHDLGVLVNSAFTSRKGQLDTNRVLGLFELKINHKLWNEAMDLIKESMTRTFSKRHVRVYQKDAEGAFQHVELNFARL